MTKDERLEMLREAHAKDVARRAFAVVRWMRCRHETPASEVFGETHDEGDTVEEDEGVTAASAHAEGFEFDDVRDLPDVVTVVERRWMT